MGFVGPGPLVRLVVGFRGAFVSAHSYHWFGYSDLRGRLVVHPVDALLGGGHAIGLLWIRYGFDVSGRVDDALVSVPAGYSGSPLGRVPMLTLDMRAEPRGHKSPIDSRVRAA